MSDSSFLKRIGATPGKLVVVAILAVVMLVVTVRPFINRDSQPSGTDDVAPVAANTRRPRLPKRLVQPAAAKESWAARKSWPTITLAQAAAYNPFVTAKQDDQSGSPEQEPGSTDQARQRETEREQLLAELREQGVTAIAYSPTQKMAVIGSYTVSVGDEVGGFRVVAIEADRVILEPIEEK